MARRIDETATDNNKQTEGPALEAAAQDERDGSSGQPPLEREPRTAEKQAERSDRAIGETRRWSELQRLASILHSEGGEFALVAEQITRMARAVETHYELTADLDPKDEPAVASGKRIIAESRGRIVAEAQRVANARIFVTSSPSGEDALFLLEHMRRAAGWLVMKGFEGVDLDCEKQALNEVYRDERLQAVPPEKLLPYLSELVLPTQAQRGTPEAAEQQQLKYPTITSTREAEIARDILAIIGGQTRQSVGAMKEAMNAARRARSEKLGERLTRPSSRQKTDQQKPSVEPAGSADGIPAACSIDSARASSGDASPGSSVDMASALSRRRSD
jgi:hypothetical protein